LPPHTACPLFNFLPPTTPRRDFSIKDSQHISLTSITMIMSVCKICDNPLVVELDLSDLDEATSSSIATTTQTTVPDDLELLNCGDHFHWCVVTFSLHGFLQLLLYVLFAFTFGVFASLALGSIFRDCEKLDLRTADGGYISSILDSSQAKWLRKDNSPIKYKVWNRIRLTVPLSLPPPRQKQLHRDF